MGAMERCGGVNFEKVVNRSPIASMIWLVPGGSPCFVSEGVRCLGYEPDDFTSGRISYEDLIHPEDASVLPFHPDPSPKAYRIADKKGGWRWILHRTCVIEGEEGLQEETLWILSDITSHKQAHREIRKTESKLAAFMDAIPAMLTVLDEDGRLIEVSGSSDGTEAVAALVGRTIGESLPMEKAAELLAPLARCVETGVPQTVAYDVEIDGKRHYHETRISLMPEPIDGRRAVVCVALDITARKELEREIMLQAEFDPLGAGTNRARFNRSLLLALAEAQRSSSSLALFMIDLDKFNLVNEAIGRDMADILLKGVGQRLHGACRQDDILYRMEGVNYYLILPKPGDKNSISAVAERVLNAIRSAAPDKRGSFKLTATIGISVFPKDGQDSKSLLRAAETALSAGKDAGGDCFRFFDPGAD